MNHAFQKHEDLEDVVRVNVSYNMNSCIGDKNYNEAHILKLYQILGNSWRFHI